MKKFKFSLQTVHNVREMRQENEEMKLVQLQSEANNLLEQIAKLEKMHHQAIENYSQKLGTGVAVNISAIKYELDQIAALETAIRNTQLSHEAKKGECKTQSLKLAQAMREVKTTDRLRLVQKVRHQLEVNRREQDSLDEIVTANFARRMT